MPSFREKMLNKLRTPEEGADTLVWMCCYTDLEKFPNSSFFQGFDNLIKVKFDLIFCYVTFLFKRSSGGQ